MRSLGGENQWLCGLELAIVYASFFNRAATFQRKFNFMPSVTIDGSRFEDFNGMKMSIHGFYKVLFSESEAWRPKVDDLPMPSL